MMLMKSHPARVATGTQLQEKKRMNDVWALDLTSFKWFKQACGGTMPRPRDKASATVCAGVMVIFGGHTQGKRLNDLCVLDLSSFAWSSWTSVMGQPSPREAAALCVGHGNLLFLHGGASNFGLDDLWVYATAPCNASLHNVPSACMYQFCTSACFQL